MHFIVAHKFDIIITEIILNNVGLIANSAERQSVNVRVSTCLESDKHETLRRHHTYSNGHLIAGKESNESTLTGAQGKQLNHMTLRVSPVQIVGQMIKG